MKYSFLSVVAMLFSCSCINAQNTDLDTYISKAIQNSPLINENNNLSKVNQLEIQRLKATYTKPQIGLSANYLFAPIISTDNSKTTFEPNSSGATNYYGYDLGASNGGEYQALLNFNQPLFGSEKYKIASEQVKVETQINENNNKLTQHDIQKIVTDQYILCLQDSKQIHDAETTLNLLSNQQAILKKLVENSIYKQSDLVLLNIDYQNYFSQLTTLKSNYHRDLLELNSICGIDDTTLVQLQDIELVLKDNKAANSLFLESYRLDSIHLAAQQNVFELQYKPQLNLYANTGLWAFTIPDIPQRFGLSAGLSLTWPIFDGNQKKINRQKTMLLQQNVSFQKKYYENQNKIRLEKILYEIKSIETQLEYINNQQNNYNILLESYKKELSAGQISIIDFLTILKNKSSLTGEYHLLFLQKQSLINAYNYWNW
ncbi:MAG: TolC family protein [Ignavibacteria bacterium]